VRVRKIIREREEIVDEQLLERTVGIERIPINRFVDEPVPVRQEEGTIIVPVMEEVVVVEKRLLLKEEVHIRTAEQSVGKPQKIILRSEEVEIERSERPDDSKGYKH
jgi:stress response protein YsnF